MLEGQGSGLNCIPQKRCSSPNPWYLWLSTYLEMWSLKIKLRNLEWDYPRFMMDPKSSDWYPYRKKIGWDFKHRDTEVKTMWKMRWKLGSCLHKKNNAKNCQQPPAARRWAWNRSSLRISRRNQCCQHLGLQNAERTNAHCFKPLSFWQFVMIDIRNEYRQLGLLYKTFSLHFLEFLFFPFS